MISNSNKPLFNRKARLVSAISGGLLILCGGAMADSGPIAKQLAGLPSEFAAMQPRDPADAAIYSKSALISVELARDKTGRLSWEGKLPVENGQLRFLMFSGAGNAWQADLQTPSGELEKSAAEFARSVKRTDFGIEQAQFPADYYTLENVESGEWTLKLSAAAGSPTRGYLLIEGNEHTELASHQTHSRQLVGERIGLAAQLAATDSNDTVTMGKRAGSIDRAELRVTYPDGSSDINAMFDDGMHADGVAGDGVFGGDFLAKSTGSYLAQVVVHGRDRSGQALVRTAEHSIPVVAASVAISDRVFGAKSQSEAGSRMRIQIPVDSAKSTQHYRAYAEVWGTNDKGDATPVAWVSGMVSPKDGALGLGFDERWVSLSGTRAPFELRNIRVEDADYFVTVASKAQMPVELAVSGVKALPTDFQIDEAMQFGPRPAAARQKGTGKRLLLVHGYCSGGVWPAGQFSTASTFLDTNQNRSHDQFARLIQTFGNTWNSYGIVAHSQGGAAALHLYTYYWSGLDNATGSRLIQSLGTPYKGTNLSGILATLGNWFGVGCGTNNNLTYSGASSWLAGIPTSSRAKVNYYTTSFRSTNWWTNDYCNFATDLVLSDPEDGTTEQTNGQLSGGVNRGHTTGQCHTSGMRDPAQFLDSGRNGVMNSNAAR